MYEYALFRWMHAVCQNLNTEEEVENVADIGFDCSMCRPYIPASNGKNDLNYETVPSSTLLIAYCFESLIWTRILFKKKWVIEL